MNSLRLLSSHCGHSDAPLSSTDYLGRQGMFDWPKKVSKPAKLEPESRWKVSIENGSIRVSDAVGKSTSIAVDDLSGVAIETNDSGPWAADVWWLFIDADDKVACAFPQGATGEQVVIDLVSALPSFDNQEMISAMVSTKNAVFPVWRKAKRPLHPTLANRPRW